MARDVEITPELLIEAYTVGMFPMAEDADDPHLHWIEPSRRCIIPLDGLKISRSLAKTVRQGRFDVRVNTAFDQVLDACAASAPGREKTWINTTIRQLYTALHRRGQVHSVECWREDMLVGGLYGVSIGAAFFGESMFHRATDASKVALVHLVERLHAALRIGLGDAAQLIDRPCRGARRRQRHIAPHAILSSCPLQIHDHFWGSSPARTALAGLSR